MSLITELSSDFSSATRSRGSDYFQEGRVKISTGSDWDVFAQVRGSRTYKVDLSIEGDELIAHCDCPQFEKALCKHIWATLLTANEKGYLCGDGDLGPLTIVPEFEDDHDYYDEDYDGEADEDEYEDYQLPRNAPPALISARRPKGR